MTDSTMTDRAMTDREPTDSTITDREPTDSHLWLLPEHAVDGFAARHGGRQLLSQAEQALLDRRRTPGARRRYLGARVLSRYALSARSGRPLSAWQFRTGADGRPEPAEPADGLRFNLSHTDGLIACLVTHRVACGVDVEPSPAGRDAVRYLPRFLADAERAVLAAAEPPELARTLAAYWVLKEAYLKARGTGLRRDLAEFAFSAPGRGPIRLDDPADPPAVNAAWKFELLYPEPGFVLAAAVENGRGGRLHRTVLS